MCRKRTNPSRSLILTSPFYDSAVSYYVHEKVKQKKENVNLEIGKERKKIEVYKTVGEWMDAWLYRAPI
jgi:type II secretory pathway component PulL